MFESTASAVSNTVGLEASFSTTLSLQRIGALKYILSHRYLEILQVGYSVAMSPKDEWHAVSNE